MNRQHKVGPVFLRHGTARMKRHIVIAFAGHFNCYWPIKRDEPLSQLATQQQSQVLFNELVRPFVLWPCRSRVASAVPWVENDDTGHGAMNILSACLLAAPAANVRTAHSHAFARIAHIPSCIHRSYKSLSAASRHSWPRCPERSI